MEPFPESLFAESRNAGIWLAISQGRKTDAQKTLADNLPRESKSLFSFLRKKPTKLSQPILQMAAEILSGESWKPLTDLRLTIDKAADEHFAEIVRLLLACDHCGQFKPQVDDLSKETLNLLVDLAEQVSVEAGEYPNHSIAGYVWVGGASIREWCNPLAVFYEHTGNLANKATTLQCKSKITASIMNHYPETIGPDMIEAAKAMEAIGITDKPRSFYNAIIADFKRIADEIKEHPEDGVMGKEIISLGVLKEAYDSLNRLNNTSFYAEELEFITAIIAGGPTYKPEEEEDDEED